MLAVKAKRDIVIQMDLEEAVETVIAGTQRKGAVISDEEKEIIRYHETGPRDCGGEPEALRPDS
jgi:cell division protease FtsH